MYLNVHFTMYEVYLLQVNIKTTKYSVNNTEHLGTSFILGVHLNTTESFSVHFYLFQCLNTSFYFYSLTEKGSEIVKVLCILTLFRDPYNTITGRMFDEHTRHILAVSAQDTGSST